MMIDMQGCKCGKYWEWFILNARGGEDAQGGCRHTIQPTKGLIGSANYCVQDKGDVQRLEWHQQRLAMMRGGQASETEDSQ